MERVFSPHIWATVQPAALSVILAQEPCSTGMTWLKMLYRNERFTLWKWRLFCSVVSQIWKVILHTRNLVSSKTFIYIYIYIYTYTFTYNRHTFPLHINNIISIIINHVTLIMHSSCRRIAFLACWGSISDFAWRSSPNVEKKTNWDWHHKWAISDST